MKITMKPLISVVTSVCNGASAIGRTIDSILNQTVDKYEYVMIDDGSSDNTYEILTRYAHNDRRVKLLRNERNLGLTTSLNKCLCVASAPYIARIDCGDVASRDRLEKQLSFMTNNAEIGIVGSNDIVIFFEFDTYRLIKRPIYDGSVVRRLMYRNCFSHSTLMIRRSVFDHFGFYRTRYAQDYDLIIRARQKYKLANLADFLCVRVQRIQDITGRKWRDQELTVFKAKIRHFNKLGTDLMTRFLASLYMPMSALRMAVPSGFKRLYNRYISDHLPDGFDYDRLGDYYQLFYKLNKR